MKVEEAITVLSVLKINEGIQRNEQNVDALIMAISALESQRWIPVTESMPALVPCNAGTAYSEAVVVLTEDRTVCTAIWNGKEWIADFDFWEDPGNVTHWKSILPLPEPPKEEST